VERKEFKMGVNLRVTVRLKESFYDEIEDTDPVETFTVIESDLDLGRSRRFHLPVFRVESGYDYLVNVDKEGYCGSKIVDTGDFLTFLGLYQGDLGAAARAAYQYINPLFVTFHNERDGLRSTYVEVEVSWS
jgi:hypothetical protein